MKIYIGSDHRGFKLKESIKIYLADIGQDVIDVGAKQYVEGDDFTEPAFVVAEKVSSEPENYRGILICGSGEGMVIAANKFKNVRAALAANADQAADSRTADDTNVLALAADFTSEADAEKIVSIWLETEFDNAQRHVRRLKKIEELENK